jgi:hypothetical protein
MPDMRILFSLVFSVLALALVAGCGSQEVELPEQPTPRPPADSLKLFPEEASAVPAEIPPKRTSGQESGR